MPVVICVAGKRKIELILQVDQPAHCIRRRRVHPNFAVPIHGHESKRRINRFVYDGQIETVSLGNQRPVVDTRAAQRIDAQCNLGAANRLHVNHAFEDLRRSCAGNRSDVSLKPESPA